MKKKLGETERLAMLRVLRTILDLVRSHPRLPSAKHGVARPLTPLIRLALADAEGRTMSVGELQKSCDLTQSATSRVVATLRQSGVIDIMPCPDKRKTTIALSKDGHAFMNEVLSAMVRALAKEGFHKAAL